MLNPLENFIQPLDKIVDEYSSEKEQAAIDFHMLVEDAFLANADKTSVVNHNTLPLQVSLRLKHDLEDGGELWIGVNKKATALGSDLYTEEIFIQERSQAPNNKYPLERGFYYTFTPGALEIIRRDEVKKTPAETAFESRRLLNQAEEFERLQKMTDEERMELMASSTRAQKREEIAALERESGLNHLPVDPQEIQGLRELVLSAGPYISPMFRGIVK